ncbi:hypothetical protein [Acetobacter persici]|uniref:hypothetical protein n=1 Tax=Acetobacter persici TaxID=1076596 RepID=UPI0020113A68|nr:hypothetical protein [Acetobacter persici]
MKESRKNDGVTISGLVRKYLPEIEKRMIEGESRDRVLNWLREETGRDIERTAFLAAFYRGRKWAKTRAAQAPVVSVPQDQLVTVAPSPKPQPSQPVRAKQDKKPEPAEPAKPSNPLSDWQARKAAMESADPIEIIKKLQEEGKIQS